jgi:uncharacterized protein YcbX
VCIWFDVRAARVWFDMRPARARRSQVAHVNSGIVSRRTKLAAVPPGRLQDRS